MEQIKDILKDRAINSTTVNSINKDTYTVNSMGSFRDRLNKFIDEIGNQPEQLAQLLANEFDDQKSIRYYKLLVKNNPPEKILEALSFTRDAYHQGFIRTKKLFYFRGILYKWGMKIIFKKTLE